MSSSLVEWAAAEATMHLSTLGRRWLHVQGVVSRAQTLQALFDPYEHAILVAAAYLHDIGYAPSLATTGFHPLDGARYMRALGQERLASLVAHHSEARFEADVRGLSDELAVFPRERSAVADALNYCDQLTGPGGDTLTLQERKTDVLKRYGESHTVAIAYRRALPYLALAVGRTRSRVAHHQRILIAR